MAIKFKKVRVFKVSKELNVSVETLVEHLQDEGYSKALQGKGLNAAIILEEAYDSLLDAFAQDKAVAARVKEKRAAREAEERELIEVPEHEIAEGGVLSEGEALQETDESEVVVEVAVVESETDIPVIREDEAPEVVEGVPDIQELQTVEKAEEVSEQVEEVELPEVAEIITGPVEEQEKFVEKPAELEPAVAKYEIDVAGEEESLVLEGSGTTIREDHIRESKDVESDAVVADLKEAVDIEEEYELEEEDIIDLASLLPDLDVDEGVQDEDDHDIYSAKRYQLAGTKILGKLDLSTVEDDKPRKRKRKRKRKPFAADKAEESAIKEKPVREKREPVAKTAPPKKRKKRKRGPTVDEADVEQTLQDTLRELEMGASRARQRRRRERRERHAADREREREEMEGSEKILRVAEFVSTGELANLMEVSVTDVISTLFQSGMIVSINQRLDADTISYVADEFGFEVEFLTEFGTDDIVIEEDNQENLQPRSPIVTVMGHVDHGKTSLLDFIRKANVVAGEAGGITQHIGAYKVVLQDQREITFLDTPGHEAFTAMRARGAKVTDVVILVVAADDAVMPQTIEAINHAKAAEVPIIVAINKIDKPNANTPRVMQQLADHNVLVEQYGGKIQCSLVSAKTGDGIDELLEKVLLESDMLELQANPDRNTVGIIIEARLEKGRGNVATVLVQNGTLEVGDSFIAGIHSGRVRAMFDERDHKVTHIGPSEPALVLGFTGLPDVGDQFIGLDEEKVAREIAQKRQQIYREQSLRQRKHITLDEIGRRLALGDFQELNLIVKGDVGGSVEALCDSLLKLSTSEVALNIIHSGVGAINERDIYLASASDAVVIGFQVRPVPAARGLAEREEIDVRLYSVIYDAIEDVHDALEGLLSPEKKEQILGTAEVREIFKVPRIGTIAGCYVIEGKIRRSDKVRVIRDGVVIYEGTPSSLKRFKDDVREVVNGYECGMGVENFNDIKIGDHLEAYEVVEEKRKLQV